MTTGIHLLIRIANGDRVDPSEVRRLLSDAAESEDYAKAIGLDRVARIKFRDTALTEAARLLSQDCAGSWIVAGRLAKAVERFMTRVLPRLRAGGRTDDLDPLDAALHRAWISGERVPRTARRLSDLVR